MSDPIRDLDDVEAQAWVLALANSDCSTMAADECVRLLRERRLPSALRDDPTIAEMARDHEREKVVAWLRDPRMPSSREVAAREFAAAIERGEHDR